MSHANAILTPAGRLRLARCVVVDGWPLRRTADRFGVSVRTAKRWADRYRELGRAGMVDRSSRPLRSPRRTPRRTERRVLGLRVSRRWGPARIAYHLGLHASTVHKVLSRYGCLRLKYIDPATGAPVRARRRQVRRYEHPEPGDLLHVDVKKLGRIPDGGGWRIHGRQDGQRHRSAHRDPTRPRKVAGRPNLGYAYLHHAQDDHSRYVYSEILDNETKETTTAFMARALDHFTALGVTVKRVLTDNGSPYRSRVFDAELAGRGIAHKRTRPYRPQTNGKVERFNRVLSEEWAYARPYASETERVAAYPEFLHAYNHHRGHTALKGATPADRVPNLSGQNN